jgi:CDP-diacylglycerol--glycerol-3-phosphate 3-phosphatidyltransferase
MLTNASFKHGFERWAEPFCAVLRRTGVSPNYITAASCGLLCLWSLIVGLGHPRLAVIAGVAGGILDALDGKIARDTGRVSTWGAFLDSSLDRVAEASVPFGMAAYFHSLGRLNLTLVFWIIAAVTGSLLVSYLRARAESLQIPCTGGLFQRTQRGVVLGLAMLINPAAMYASIVIVAVGTYGTAVQRFYLVHKAATKVP